MSDPSRNSRLLKRSLLGALAVVVLFNVVAYFADEAGGARRGPPSSSYTTSPEGLAAYADLLVQAGHPIARLRTNLVDEPPPSDATLVMLDPGDVSFDDAQALGDFVDSGGRLVAGGRSFPGWLEEVVLTRPVWSPGGDRTVGVGAPAREVEGIEEVRTSAEGYWSYPGSTLPVLSNPGSVVASVETVGRGRVVLLADSTILQNELIDEADNAAFGLQAAGRSSRPVVFVESIHGYGTSAESGLAAIPDRWAWALTGLLLATFVFMWARGRRLGPPQEPDRALPPPRHDYVEALGGILARTRDLSTVGETLQRGLRNRLARRAGGATGDEDLERAAAMVEMRAEDVRVLKERAENERDLMVLARAVATLERKTKRGSRP